MTAPGALPTRKLNPRICRGCGVVFMPTTALQRYGNARCKERGMLWKSRAGPGAEVRHR